MNLQSEERNGYENGDIIRTRLIPKLKMELTEEEIDNLEEPYHLGRNSPVKKTKGESKHIQFGQVLQEMKNKKIDTFY